MRQVSASRSAAAPGGASRECPARLPYFTRCREAGTSSARPGLPDAVPRPRTPPALVNTPHTSIRQASGGPGLTEMRGTVRIAEGLISDYPARYLPDLRSLLLRALTGEFQQCASESDHWGYHSCAVSDTHFYRWPLPHCWHWSGRGRHHGGTCAHRARIRRRPRRSRAPPPPPPRGSPAARRSTRRPPPPRWPATGHRSG